MVDLLKMDLYRMFSSVQFKLYFALTTLVSFASKPINQAIARAAANLVRSVDDSSVEGKEQAIQSLESVSNSVPLSSDIADPFGYTVLYAVVFISVIAFAYADTAHGYIKNYVGQLPSRGHSIISKFCSVCVHNLVFITGAFAGSILGDIVTRGIYIDSGIPEATGAFFLKLLLLQAISAILLFFTAGIRQKTIASILGVLFGTGLLGLAYYGLNSLLANVFGIKNVDIAAYAPDQLLTTSGVIPVSNSLISACAVIAVFLPLTVKIFNSKDVK